VPVPPSVDVVSMYDLGRLKTYFSIGAEFQSSGGSLGTASGFFGTNIDENWLTTGPDKDQSCASSTDSEEYREELKGKTPPRPTARPTALSSEPPCGAHPFRFLFNTFVEGELTQIPISSSSSNSSGTPPTGSAVIAKASTTTAPTTTSTTSGSGTIDISKAKGAYVAGGIYTPFLLPAMQWHYRGQANAFFFAPMAEYSFLVPDSTPTGAIANFNTYRAYAGGVRIGHFRLPAHFNREGPELLSYLDITAGKWENYREANGVRGVRLDVNGRYKIPYTLLYIGFDANTGPGGSDFRVFAGTRVDVSTILGKLLPSSN
jgi:hypothetical protein